MLKACLIFTALPVLVLVGVLAFFGLSWNEVSEPDYQYLEPSPYLITAIATAEMVEVPTLAPSATYIMPTEAMATLPPTWTPAPSLIPSVTPTPTLTP